MPTSGAKFKEAEAKLPAELRGVFHDLVQDYEDLTVLRFGQGHVAYKVLADLMLAGWRRAAEPPSGEGGQ